MSDNSVTIRIRLKEAAKFAAETRAAKEEIKGLGDEAERANRKSRAAGGGLAFMQKSLKLLKPALIVAGLGLLIQTMNLGIAGAVGFAGALAPLAGLLGALPGAFLLAGQSAGVFALAFSGVKGALGGLNGELDPKKFAALSSEGQQFVLTLDSMKGPIKGLQGTVQRGLFPGLTAGLKAAAPLLGVLKKPLEGTGKVLGAFGDKLGHLVGSGGFLTDLRQQANFNNVQLARLGGAGLHVVDALRQIMVASRPLVSWLVRLASGWAATADKTLIADRHNGKLAGTFKTIQRVTSSVFKVLGNLGKTIFNVGNIGRKSLGESLLGSLVKGSESLKKWSESGPGIAKITAFFVNAKPAVYAFANLIGGAVKDFLKFGSSPGSSRTLVQFFNQLRTEVLPQLLKVTEGVTKLFELITSKVPGGGWLITFGYALHQLGGGGLIGGIAQGLGKRFGEKMAGGLVADSVLSKFKGAGTKLGDALGKAAAVATIALIGAAIAKKLPNVIQKIEHLAPWLKPSGGKYEKPAYKNLFGQVLDEKPGEGGPQYQVNLYRHLLKQHPHGKEHANLLHILRLYEGDLHPSPTGPPMHKGAAFHGPTLRAPTTAVVRREGSSGRGGETPVHLHSHTTIKLNDKPIAEGTNEVVQRLKALG